MMKRSPFRAGIGNASIHYYGPIMTPFAFELQPPYFAVIFSSQLRSEDRIYQATARRMVELAAAMPGFLGIESARGADGFGITVSYWRDEEAIAQWRTHSEHLATQQRGKHGWYEHYELRVAKVDRAYAGPEGRG